MSPTTLSNLLRKKREQAHEIRFKGQGAEEALRDLEGHICPKCSEAFDYAHQATDHATTCEEGGK